MTQQEYEHMVSRLRPRLKDIGRQFFGNEDMAEDIAQETLMRLWMLRERIKAQMDIEPLAVRMAKNLCVSEWRKQKVRQGNAQQVKLIAHEDVHRDVEMKEEVLRADARLQKLVQRIMMGELTKDDVPAEAMNTNQTMEEQP